MTQEEKSLLLQDLCARLPHGVICQTDEHGKNYKLKGINKHKGIWWYEFDGFRTIKLPKPYLRPLSSMTEDEKKELGNFVAVSMFASRNKNPLFQLTREALYGDFFNKHHFDYRGLIEKDLAIEVTKENNPYD